MSELQTPQRLTEQEIFDRVAQHLRQQGAQATRAGGGCLYRTREGLMCAVGCLIPEDQYRPEFDNTTELRYLHNTSPELFSDGQVVWETGVLKLIKYSHFKAALLAGGVDAEEHLDLLRYLQEIHDAMDNGYTADTALALQRVARHHGLSTDCVMEP